MALMVCALYSMRNELRRNPDRSELRQCISRLAGDAAKSPAQRQAWRDVFGWSLGRSPSPAAQRSVLSALQARYTNRDIDDITLIELAQL